MLRWLAYLIVLTAPAAAVAEQAQKFGDIEVHYNAMLTSDLSPEVAKTYKIDRSNTRGLLTVSVLKKNGSSQPVPIVAKVSAYLVNLNSQLGTIDLREIREGTAIYYLGEFRVAPPDTLKFNLTVGEPGRGKREIAFSQTFYR